MEPFDFSNPDIGDDGDILSDTYLTPEEVAAQANQQAQNTPPPPGNNETTVETQPTQEPAPEEQSQGNWWEQTKEDDKGNQVINEDANKPEEQTPATEPVQDSFLLGDDMPEPIKNLAASIKDPEVFKNFENFVVQTSKEHMDVINDVNDKSQEEIEMVRSVADPYLLSAKMIGDKFPKLAEQLGNEGIADMQYDLVVKEAQFRQEPISHMISKLYDLSLRTKHNFVQDLVNAVSDENQLKTYVTMAKRDIQAWEADRHQRAPQYNSLAKNRESATMKRVANDNRFRPLLDELGKTEAGKATFQAVRDNLDRRYGHLPASERLRRAIAISYNEVRNLRGEGQSNIPKNTPRAATNNDASNRPRDEKGRFTKPPGTTSNTPSTTTNVPISLDTEDFQKDLRQLGIGNR